MHARKRCCWSKFLLALQKYDRCPRIVQKKQRVSLHGNFINWYIVEILSFLEKHVKIVSNCQSLWSNVNSCSRGVIGGNCVRSFILIVKNESGVIDLLFLSCHRFLLRILINGFHVGSTVGGNNVVVGGVLFWKFFLYLLEYDSMLVEGGVVYRGWDNEVGDIPSRNRTRFLTLAN